MLQIGVFLHFMASERVYRAATLCFRIERTCPEMRFRSRFGSVTRLLHIDSCKARVQVLQATASH